MLEILESLERQQTQYDTDFCNVQIYVVEKQKGSESFSLNYGTQQIAKINIWGTDLEQIDHQITYDN